MKINFINTYTHTNSIKNNAATTIPRLLSFQGQINTSTVQDQWTKSGEAKSKDINTVGETFKDRMKIVFSDVDSTISEKDDFLTAKTISSINFLHKNKIPVILTTARCYNDTVPILEQFEENPEYTIILQGGGIVDKEGKILCESKISKSDGKKLINWYKKLNEKDKNTHLVMYFEDQPYSLSNVQFPWKASTLIKQIDSFDGLFNENKSLQKAIVFNSNADEANFDPALILNSFNKANINNLDIKMSGHGFYELQNKDVSKDKAVDFILKKLRLNPDSAIAVGDSTNDIEMLDFIRENNGLAIAMGNASDSVKEHANAITTSVTDEGFFNAIKAVFSKSV